MIRDDLGLRQNGVHEGHLQELMQVKFIVLSTELLKLLEIAVAF